MGVAICTVAADNYLSKAAVLAESLKEADPTAPFILCSLERDVNPALVKSPLFDTVMSASVLYDNFDRFAFRHSVLECATAVKARLLSFVLRKPGVTKAIYLDPDMAVYGPLTEAEEALERAAILATPFHLNRVPGKWLVPLLRTGAFNLGFLAVRACPEAADFLEWWDEKLSSLCYVDTARGLFVDQKWMDIAVSLFKIDVFRDAGYNVAHWNLADRPISCADGAWLGGGGPLRCFHFSNLDLGRDLRSMRKVAPLGSEPVHLLRQAYKDRLTAASRTWPTAAPWSYDFFDSGEQIAYETRVACRMEPRLLQNLTGSPYGLSNEYFLSRSQL